MTRIPWRTGHRIGGCGALCRQRRVLPVAGDGGRRGKGPAFVDLRHQRRRCSAGLVDRACRRNRQDSALRLPTGPSAARSAGHRRHPPGAVEGRSRPCQRAVEDLFDPCRGPARAGLDRWGFEVPRILAESGGGVCVPPDAPEALRQALERLAGDPSGRDTMAAAGRRWVETAASPAAVARAYADLIVELNRR